ncbi:MAG: hydantoinase/oxoprolinase family protein [Syntrophomonadaceae bacterium]|nr:hydantoinase/oxoprolinase family protein [Syntrophomonadaceae bacterium]
MKSGTIIDSVKTLTNNSDISASLFSTLDKLLKSVTDLKLIERIVISTTTVTNLITTGRLEPVAVILLPGYGLPNSYYEIGEHCYFLKGAIDFRGNEVESINNDEVKKCLNDIKKKGIKRIAIAGKFSNRNNKHEKQVKELAEKYYPDAFVLMSSEVSNQLNFRRRAATAYYTAMTYFEWNSFVDNVVKALQARQLDNTEVHILKADGGTIPLEVSRDYPCQTIYSGPAASTMGGIALTMDKANSVVIDIGGTTSDISLIIEGQPLHVSKGALINENFTHVEAFSLTSIPLGGDSQIVYEDNSVQVLNKREDFAVCFGGKWLTVTDVFNHHYDLKIGEYQKSTQVVNEFASQCGMSEGEVTSQIIEIVLSKLENAINSMFIEWEKEPAYKVWEVVNNRKFKLERIIGIGAAATAIIPVLAKKLGVPYYLHEYSPIANALGTAVARPTINVNLHVDTQLGYYSIEPGGHFGKISNTNRFSLNDAKDLALQHLNTILNDRGLNDYVQEATFYMEEQFNVIRGWDRIGRIFDIGVQVKPGFIKEYTGVV